MVENKFYSEILYIPVIIEIKYFLSVILTPKFQRIVSSMENRRIEVVVQCYHLHVCCVKVALTVCDVCSNKLARKEEKETAKPIEYDRPEYRSKTI